MYVKRALPSTSFDYWAVHVGGAANQNKHLLPVSKSLPFNHLPWLILEVLDTTAQSANHWFTVRNGQKKVPQEMWGIKVILCILSSTMWIEGDKQNFRTIRSIGMSKAIETGMILLIMDIKKLLLSIFPKTYKFWCIEGVLYWCKYPFLTTLDKWRQKIVTLFKFFLLFYQLEVKKL